jgi:ribosome biogenesis GTPase A
MQLKTIAQDMNNVQQECFCIQEENGVLEGSVFQIQNVLSVLKEEDDQRKEKMGIVTSDCEEAELFYNELKAKVDLLENQKANFAKACEKEKQIFAEQQLQQGKLSKELHTAISATAANIPTLENLQQRNQIMREELKRLNIPVRVYPNLNGNDLNHMREDGNVDPWSFTESSTSHVGLKSSTRERTILVIGETGAGKSTFINITANYFLHGTLDNLLIAVPNKFHKEINYGGHVQEHSERDYNAESESQTDKTTEYSFLKLDNAHKFIFIDTPGLGDTRGTQQDDLNVDKILKAASSTPNLAAVVLIVNGTNARFNIVS